MPLKYVRSPERLIKLKSPERRNLQASCPRRRRHSRGTRRVLHVAGTRRAQTSALFASVPGAATRTFRPKPTVPPHRAYSTTAQSTVRSTFVFRSHVPVLAGQLLDLLEVLALFDFAPEGQAGSDRYA